MGDFDFMGGDGLEDAMDLGAFGDGLGGISADDDGFGDLGGGGFGDLGGGLDDFDFGGGKKKKKGKKGAGDGAEDIDDLFSYTPKV